MAGKRPDVESTLAEGGIGLVVVTFFIVATAVVAMLVITPVGTVVIITLSARAMIITATILAAMWVGQKRSGSRSHSSTNQCALDGLIAEQGAGCGTYSATRYGRIGLSLRGTGSQSKA